MRAAGRERGEQPEMLQPRWIALAVLAPVLCGCAAAAATLHRAPDLPVGWTLETLRSTSQRVRFSFSVVQNPAGVEAVRRRALRASNPADALYGVHLSAEQVAHMCAPNAEALRSVHDWLTAGGCRVASTTNELVLADCSIESAEALLSTSVHLARNSETGQSAQWALDFALPEHIENVVAAVYSLHGLPLLSPTLVHTRTSPPSQSSEPAAVTPDILRSTYKVGSSHVGSRSVKNRQAVVEFAGETMNSTDLATFFAKFVTNADHGDAKVYMFQGDPGNGRDALEGALDIQYIMGVAPKILTEFWCVVLWPQSVSFARCCAHWLASI